SVPRDVLIDLATRLTKLPPGFHANPKVKGVLDLRRERVESGQSFDWGTGEHLAFASLVAEGRRIRITGQDSRRVTFTDPHATLFAAETGMRFTPLANLADPAKGGRFEIHDSPLSEAGVLGFEYGYSLDSPDSLVIWEAQFGDFANGAQVIID